MVESIKIGMELEGGEEIDRQLAATAEAGKKMFADLQKAGDQIDFSTVSDQFQTVGNAITGAASAVKSAASFEVIIKGVKQVEGAFESLGNAVTKMATRMTRSMGILGVAARAFGPVGIAAGLMGASVVKGTLAAAESINQLNLAALKLDSTVQQLDTLRQGMQKFGVSGDAFKEVLAGLEKIKLEGLQKALKEIEERNYGEGSKQLKLLQEAAKGIGPAADFAREALEKLSRPIPKAADGFKTLAELVTDLGQEKGMQAFIEQLAKLPPGAERAKIAIRELKSEAAGLKIERGLTAGVDPKTLAAGVKVISPEQLAAINEMDNALDRLKAKWKDFGQTLEGSKALTSIFDFLGRGLVEIEAGIATTVTEFKALGSAIDTFASGGAAAIKFTADTIVDMGRALAEIATQIAGFTWGAITAGVEAWNSVNAAIQSAYEWLLKFVGLKSQAGGTPLPGGAPVGSGGIGSNAAGGLLGGRGSGTSDSNLAWVSRGEHIMPARAVGQPGVLAFLEALRRSGGNLSAVLDGMGRFALGGMVPRPAMAFAAGGPVGSMSNVTIQFPGLPAIGGLRASSDVIDQLHKAAALAQVRSGGRKPSRYT